MFGRAGVIPPFFVMKDYSEEILAENVVIRTFRSKEINHYEWHRDKEDRKIVVLESSPGWKFQMDNCLPVDLYLGKVITIPKEAFHRLIGAPGKLKIRIIKYFT